VNLLGPDGLIILGVACLGLMIAFGALNGWLRWRASLRGRFELDPNSIEAAPTYRRFITVAAWSSGSGRNWDSNVRPVLAELLESTAGGSRSSRGESRAAVHDALGPDMAALCDRDGRCADVTAKGPGRHVLRKILEELDGG
jgi:hypothetical protein